MSKYRMIYQAMLFIIGVLLIILGFVGNINDIWFSIGIAFVTCSTIRITRYTKMAKNPEYKEKIEIAQTDERNIKIAEKTASTTFRIGILTMCIAELFLFAFEMKTEGTILGLAVCGFLFLYWIMFFVYNKKI